ncbi:MAG TPA: HEAT repeat domain-containing protein [Ktedonobacterales bacterium]|nr:HEAT repeat domain-containing protein [Ktedonobacterales bacterium]
MLPGHEPQPSDDAPGDLIEPFDVERQTGVPEAPPPPVGTTPPATLAALAAQGRRGAAWRLLHWIAEDNQEALAAIRTFPDRRLLDLLLEWLALGAWADKPFQVPRAMRQPHFRTQVSTLFLPGAGASEAQVKAVLCAGLHHSQAAVRETAAHLLGIVGDPTAAADLAEALHDPASAVRVQAAKALGRLRVPGTSAALVGALRYHDEALASQVRQALLQLGAVSVPALVEAAPTPDSWVRWHVLRVLGELHNLRGLRPLVDALADEDFAVAWMAARALITMDTPVVEEVLRLLLRAPDTPRLMETAGYVLRAQTRPEMKALLGPVLQSMHQTDYRVAVPLAVEGALEQLAARGSRSG